MKTARYCDELQRYQLQCRLCPHNCVIGDEKTGICKVRKNVKGELYLDTWGIFSSMGFDPIEKKPLYHFYPGKIIFSIGSYGCNLRCKFCQNWEISQEFNSRFDHRKKYTPESLVEMAQEKYANVGIAFTYNEPIVWFEYMVDIAEKSKSKGLKNVMVTNGFINHEPLHELLEYIDAFNVDLKAFTEDFYKTLTRSILAPVKETLKSIRKSGKHLEITNLVVTGQNDQKKDFQEMVKWIAGELGTETVFHISRYFPTYKMSVPPTPVNVLDDLYNLAKEHLSYVYVGNLATSNGQNTYCAACGSKVIDRSRYDTWVSGLDDKGFCKNCGNKVLAFI